MYRLYTAVSRKVVGKNVHAQPRKVIWDMINILFLTTVAVEPTFLLSISTREHMSVAYRAILSNFFGEQGRQNHPQYLSECTFSDNLSPNSCIYLPDAAGSDKSTFLFCHSKDCRKSGQCGFPFHFLCDGQGSCNRCSFHRRQTFK